MSFATIKFDGEECEVEYEFDAEDLIVQLVGIGDDILEFTGFHDRYKKEIEEKVLAYIEDQKISSREADWMYAE